MTYVKPYRFRLASGIVFNTLFGVSSGLLPLVVKKVWAGVLEQPTSAEPLSWPALIGLSSLLPLVFLVRGTCDFIGVHQMNWVGLRVVMDLRVKAFEHLQKLSLDYFNVTPTGEIISRVSNDAGLLQQSISNVVEDIVRQPVALISVVVFLLTSDWKLTLMALTVLPMVLVPILSYGRKTSKAARRGQQSQASFVGVLHEAITGFRVVRAFNMEKREAEDFRALCREFFRQRLRVVHSRALTSPIIELIAGMTAAVVFVYAYRMGMPSSKLVAIATSIYLLYDPVKKIGRVHLQIQESMSAADRVFQVLDMPPTVVERPSARELPRLRSAIRFDHVSFRYGADGVVLENIDLEVPAGSSLAIVGASGAGKTTLFNLLPRFYDPTQGAVRIDGVDVREGTFKSLRDQIGLVAQETFLFNDTVANNIAYGKPGAARGEIIDAAQRAHAHEFIMQMPQQYDTVTGESGMKLSGGQRQRLAIARAILKNPPILLLDEATSALDTESERTVQAALDDLMWGGKQKKSHTMLVIAHRLSTVQHADRIIVLDKGRIVEQGTHDQLLARDQVYRRLYEMQFNA